MKKWLLSVLTAAFLFVSSPALGQGVEYVGNMRLQGWEYMTSSGSVTLQWDVVTGIPDVWYEIRVIMFDKEPNTTYAAGITSETSILILRPRSGHFRFEVRACRYSDCHCEPDSNADPCTDDRSGWAQSTNPAHGATDLDGDGVYEPMGWWVYWKTPPPIIN